ncbi:MAG: hypothetical protein ACK58L_06080 [Planctomycetota bacterium]
MNLVSHVLRVALLVCSLSSALADEVPEGVLQIRPARRPANRQTIWGLNENDNFTVSVNIDKETSVQIDDQPDIVTHTNDRLSLSYYIAQVLPDGDCVVIVEAAAGERFVDETSPEAIKQASRYAARADQPSVTMIVHPDGSTELQAHQETRNLIQSLAAADSKAKRILSDSLTDDVVLGWLSTPFWATSKSLDQQQQAATVARSLVVAAGNFGSIRIDAELKTLSPEGDYTSLELLGQGRFTPLALPEKVAQSRDSMLSSVSMEVSEFSGRARLWTPVTPQSEQQEGRPLLDDLTLTWRLKGKATLPARANRPERQLSFTQAQTQSWLMTAHSVGLQHGRLSPAMPIQLR